MEPLEIGSPRRLGEHSEPTASRSGVQGARSVGGLTYHSSVAGARPLGVLGFCSSAISRQSHWPMRILRQPIARSDLVGLADAQFGDMVKAVVINVRPSQNNRSRDVADEERRDAIRAIVRALVTGE